jgi:hypothetical protein
VLRLSVVVPATDEPPTLSRCVDALERGIDEGDELIVVTAPSELSASEARNAGVSGSTGDVVVFVDADVVVHEDALARVRRAFEDDPDLTALHGSYDDTPDDRRTVSAFRNLLHHHVHQSHAGPAETFWSGLGAVRRGPFLAIGGFDGDRYPLPSIEDIQAAGGHLRLDPTIQGTHLKRWTLRTMVWTDLVRRGIPWVALQARTRRVATTLNMGWTHRVSALLIATAIVALITGAIGVAAGALASTVVLNRTFYGLLIRQLGVRAGLAGVTLHWLHQLIAVVSVPLGLTSAGAAAVRGAARRATDAEAQPATGTVPS